MYSQRSCFGSALSAPLLSSSRSVRTSTAAKITGLSERTLRLYAQTGTVPAVRRGKRCWYFKVRDLLILNIRRGHTSEFHPASWSEKSPANVAAFAGEIRKRVIPSSGGAL